MNGYTADNLNRQAAHRHTLSLKKSIAKTRRRARRAGLLYLLGTIACVAFAIFPLLGMPLVKSEQFDFTFDALLATFKGLEYTSVAFWNAALFTLLVLATVINFFRALKKVNWLFKKKGSRVYGFNRPAYAMETIGERCTGSFAAIVLTYFVMCVLAGVDVTKFVMDDVFFLIVAVGVGLVIQILCGICGSKTTFFIPRPGAEIAEQKSEAKPFKALLCNLVQVAGGLAMMYFFLSVSTVSGAVDSLVNDGFGALTEDMMKLISVALQVLLMLFTLGFVKHAMGIVEYNAAGKIAPGMKTARTLAIFILLLSGGAWAVYFINKPEADKIVYDLLMIAGVAFVVFVLDALFKRDKKIKEEEEETSLQNGAFPPPTMQAQTDRPVNLPPIYIQVPSTPVPMPMPVPMPVPMQNGAPTQTNVTVVPPVYEKPAPVESIETKETVVAPVELPVIEPEKKTEKIEEEETGRVAYVSKPGEERDWVVGCPACQKPLKINDSALYHRCPACNGVFQIEKKQSDKRVEPKEETFSLVDFEADPFNE